ncbi:hypothetical protein EV1_020944 [Malus domestica]
MSDGKVKAAKLVGSEPHDVVSLPSASERDFLVRNNGDQIKFESLKGKKLGLYFSASWCSTCERFTPALVEAYNELSPKGDFEIVFISADEDDESFKGYFAEMPWLAIPFSDSEARNRVNELFKVREIPHLVILGEDGKVLSDSGVRIIQKYGADAYPFTLGKLKELKNQEEAARRDQSLKTILVTRSRDFVISNDAEKVPVSELEGKIVGLYFSLFSSGACVEFTPKLVEAHEKLKANGENFEIVLVPLDDDEESFKQYFEKMPWFSLPIGDKSVKKLARYFEHSTLPTVVIIGADGKTLSENVADAIDEHGSLAYPFTPEKFAELVEIDKAKGRAQTLESILISGDRNFVIGKDGTQIPVTDLVGKNILLYFSAHRSRACRAFLPKLVEAYHEIKAKDDAFEVIFISSDKGQNAFDKVFATMPWLALPFGDSRKASLKSKFKVPVIPKLIAIGPTGQTVTKEATNLIRDHGANAYPFTEERMKEIKAEFEMARGWPEKLKSALHEKHELVLWKRTAFVCDGCGKPGVVWSFYCKECDFDLHPKCALEGDKKTENGAKQAEEEECRRKFIPPPSWLKLHRQNN